MGYINPNVVREIYLTLPKEEQTLEQYKEKYGVDFKSFISLAGNVINVDFGYAKVYLVGNPHGLYVKQATYNISSATYSAGVRDGEALLLVTSLDNLSEPVAYGIRFFVDKDEEFDIDNVKLTYYEL